MFCVISLVAALVFADLWIRGLVWICSKLIGRNRSKLQANAGPPIPEMPGEKIRVAIFETWIAGRLARVVLPVTDEMADDPEFLNIIGDRIDEMFASVSPAYDEAAGYEFVKFDVWRLDFEPSEYLTENPDSIAY